MKKSFSDIVAIVSVGIALLALLVSLYASSVAHRVATSDFQAAELVKIETAQIIAVFRALTIKGIVYSQQDKSKRDDPQFERFVDTSSERDAIEVFMHSSTALAYYTFVAKKSKVAREAGVQGEEWRTFFLQLAELRQTPHPWLAAKAAVKLEALFDEIGETELKDISSYLDDLPKAITLLFCEREYDTLSYAIFELDDNPITDENFADC